MITLQIDALVNELNETFLHREVRNLYPNCPSGTISVDYYPSVASTGM